MLEKSIYHAMKKEIKSLCRSHVLQLCSDLQLNDYEKQLLLDFYDGKSRIETSMNLNINVTKYTLDLEQVFTKLYDYKNTH